MDSPYSAYLQEHVQTELTKAIAEATIRQPKDTVDFIGNYLLQIVEDNAKRKQRKEIQDRWNEEDHEFELKRKEQQLIAQKKENEQKAKEREEEDFYVELVKCSNKIEAMQSWTKYIKNKTKSCSVYIGTPCKMKQDDEDVNGLLYDAVSSKHDEFLLNTTFIQSESKGVIFDLLSEENAEEEEEENEDDENAEKKKDETTKQRKNIHIKNVLLPNEYKDRLHFFTYPKVGSFLSFESSIKSYLNNKAIQAQLRDQWPRPIEEIIAEQKAKEEAEKKEKEQNENNEEPKEAENNEDDQDKDDEDKDDEDINDEDKGDEDKDDEQKEELPADPPQTAIKYIVSMDTLGDQQIYDQNTVEWIDKNIGKFEQILMKIDVNEYLKQREFEQNIKTQLIEYEEKTKGEIDAKLAEIEKENESNAEQIKSFKKHQHVIEATYSVWSCIVDHIMKPQQPSFCRIVAAFIKLFDNEQENKLSLINKELSQFDVISDAAWNQCLKCLKEVTSEKVNGFNPNEMGSFDVSLFDKLLDGIVGEEIGKEGLAIIVTILYEFTDSVCKLYKFTEEEKKKEAEKPEDQNQPEQQVDAE